MTVLYDNRGIITSVKSFTETTVIALADSFQNYL